MDDFGEEVFAATGHFGDGLFGGAVFAGAGRGEGSTVMGGGVVGGWEPGRREGGAVVGVRGVGGGVRVVEVGAGGGAVVVPVDAETLVGDDVGDGREAVLGLVGGHVVDVGGAAQVRRLVGDVPR